MKLSVAIAIAAAFTGVQAAAVSEDGGLMRRQCTATSCSCAGVPSDGLFCGDGFLGCKVGTVYQCGDGGKKACEYGVRKSCQQCNKLQC